MIWSKRMRLFLHVQLPRKSKNKESRVPTVGRTAEFRGQTWSFQTWFQSPVEIIRPGLWNYFFLVDGDFWRENTPLSGWKPLHALDRSNARIAERGNVRALNKVSLYILRSPCGLYRPERQSTNGRVPWTHKQLMKLNLTDHGPHGGGQGGIECRRKNCSAKLFTNGIDALLCTLPSSGIEWTDKHQAYNTRPTKYMK